MDIQPAEISAILKKKVKEFGKEAEVSEIGQVLSVGDGIARIYGLDNVEAGEMVEFPGGIKGMALNLEEDNVGVVISDFSKGSLLKGCSDILNLLDDETLKSRCIETSHKYFSLNVAEKYYKKIYGNTS